MPPALKSATQRRSQGHVSLALIAIAVGLVAQASVAFAADEPRVSFKQDIAPLMARYCIDCHGGGSKKAKGGVDVASFVSESIAPKDRKVWEKIVENIESGTMPPEDKPQMTDHEVARISDWVKGQFASPDCGLIVPGRVTMRRLNRTEYNNTTRDLLGIDLHLADDFPSDDVGYGFDNIGDVLTLPPLLFEKYLAAAEQLSEAAILTQRVVPGPKAPLLAEGKMLASESDIVKPYTFPKDGQYVVRVRAYGDQAGTEPAKMAIRLDGKDLAVLDVPATEDTPGTYEVKVDAKAGQSKVSAAFLNDFYVAKSADKPQQDRNLFIESIEVQGPAQVVALPESHTRILFRESEPGKEREAAKEILGRLVGRAYRRPVRNEEIERLVQLVLQVQQDGETFERGIQLALQAVLASPNFLYRVETERRKTKLGEPIKPGDVEDLNDHELASRLSYFLWSSMPDDELLALAAEGSLKSPATLESQARRMLKDPKSRALVEEFGGQWLQLRNLKTINPDPALFPGFDDALRTAMRRETELFFESIVREDRTLTEFLDSDYTYLNERLAKHYGIEGVTGDDFRKVVLTGDRRGGVLTHASVLTVTSNPTRTSPVKRGKWILEQILGSPPPPPPPDVPVLDDAKGQLTGSLRQRMEQHRANPSCASCHARMDPLGFGFENYDAVGAWRDVEGPYKVDASGELPSGQTFGTPKQLKGILVGKRDAFSRCLAEKMMTYATGRGLDYRDQCMVDRVVAALSQDEYKFSRLVVEIVKSDPFRRRGGQGSEP
jgi:mono/diheme cytochrome c family protein